MLRLPTLLQLSLGRGTLAYSAAGLPPGISINSSTGIISGTTDEVGDSTFTVTVTGANAAGAVRTTSKTYIIKVSDPDSFSLQVRFHTVWICWFIYS